jgi:hypothetical protein
MKNILIILFIAISHWAQAQWHFTTKDIQIYDWVDEKWEYRNGEMNHIVKYEFNAEFTFFSLTEKKDEYIYKILNYEYERENHRYLLDILSEDGTEYFMILDFREQNIRFLSDEGFCVLHNIKQAKRSKEEKISPKKL